MKIKISLLIFAAAINIGIPDDISTTTYAKYKMGQAFESIKQGRLPIEPYLRLVSAGTPAFAEGSLVRKTRERQSQVFGGVDRLLARSTQVL